MEGVLEDLLENPISLNHFQINIPFGRFLFSLFAIANARHQRGY